MNAKELIDRLSQVSPETEVKVATETGVFGIADVLSLGYSGGRIEIVVED